MDCKSVIDMVVEARDLEDRRVGSIISTLRPKVLANIDSGIKNTVDYMENLIRRYESMPDPVETMALGGDMLSDPEPTYEGLQATHALFQLYTHVLAIYRNQDESTPLIKLPGQFRPNGQLPVIGEFVPDIWDGRAAEVWEALNVYRKSDDSEWADVLTPHDVRRIWESLKALIPTTQCIDMANMRKILANDRSEFAKDAVQMWRKLKPLNVTSKRSLYNWATSYPGIGVIEAGTDLDKVSIFVDDLQTISGYRPHP